MKVLATAALSAAILFCAHATFAQPAAAGAPATSPAAAGATGKVSPFSTTGITADRKGQYVNIAGTVEKFQAARTDRAPNSFTLRDSAGTIRVAIWNDTFSKVPNKELLKDGALVNVKAEIALFKDTPELHVKDPADLQFLKPGEVPAAAGIAAAPPVAANAVAPAPIQAATPTVASAPVKATAGGITPISQLTKAGIDQVFTISGSVASARKPSSETAPYVFKITDASGSVDVVFWKDLADQLAPGQKLEQGDKVHLTGKLGEHRGVLQLRISELGAIKTQKTDPALFQGGQAPAATPQAAAQKVSLDLFASAQPGSRVQIEGNVAEIEPIRTGRRVALTNGTAKADVLLWDTAIGLKTAAHTLKPQDKIVLEGKVDQVAGKPVLVVSRPEDVIAVSQ